ncbi:hypothetical protein WT60_03685 [Burkholderia sp. MSMB617WGS]|uniref:Uncharacterized protein n=1 Tax=Burkholderia savannae TaxID=1637837 RepID=A0ABR5TEP3_9BURK|nr:hypothetical protein WT60_03685 [Burkholderia sp. MSMB617WGS]KVK79567.1 hypothetical protein WS91_13005 [Burkholderia sp. MSMB1498]KWZ42027.1 hypothetical protein WS72_03460 [Burkholderia savannae]
MVCNNDARRAGRQGGGRPCFGRGRAGRVADSRRRPAPTRRPRATLDGQRGFASRAARFVCAFACAVARAVSCAHGRGGTSRPAASARPPRPRRARDPRDGATIA